MKYSEILTERILGNLALVYHRANKDAIDVISEKGFSRIGEGSGNLYGPGVYTCYEFQSQQTDNNLKYGEYILESKLNISGFLIFDQKIAKIIYGDILINDPQNPQLKIPSYSIKNQLKINKYQLNDDIDIDEIDTELNSINEHGETTSNIALKFFHKNKSAIQGGHKIVPGIIFTGGRDGHVAVIFHLQRLIPYRYCYSGPTEEEYDSNSKQFENLSKTYEQMEWHKINIKTSIQGAKNNKPVHLTNWDTLDILQKNCRRGITGWKGNLNLEKENGDPDYDIEAFELNNEDIPDNLTIVQGDFNLERQMSIFKLPSKLKQVTGTLNISATRINNFPPGLQIGNLNANACGGYGGSALDLNNIIINHHIDLSNSVIKNFPEFWIHIKGNLILSHCNIDYLNDHMIIDGNLYIDYTNIKEWPKNLIVKGKFSALLKQMPPIPENVKIGSALTIPLARQLGLKK